MDGSQDHLDDTAASTEVIPAGHAAFIAEEEVGEHRSETFTGFAGLSVADPSQISFFVGRANVKPSSRPGMARWRERLYSALTRVATRRPEVLRIPPDRVIELGAEVEI